MSTLSNLKKHPALIPLFGFVGGGVVFSLYYLGRLSIRNPDFSWTHKHDGVPNSRWPINKQYKFYSPVRDYSKLAEPEGKPKF